MLSSYFTPEQQAALGASCALGLCAVGLYVRGRERWSLITLTLAAVVLRLFAATLDPFLNNWDEVFHAVVGRNMIGHPFTPMLYTETAMPVTDLWAQSHVWLNKPPFFLWQIALSLNIFGTHAWAVRIPGAIWWTALVPVVWKMGRLLANDQVGFSAAVLCTFAYYPQELVAGAICTDQNDAVFIALLGFSWWATLEYLHAPKWRWVLLLGFFCSAAVLTKWYVGYSAFLPLALILAHRRFPRAQVVQVCMALFASILIPAAWACSIRLRFPKEAICHARFESAHFWAPLDGHSGSWTFHFDVIADLIPPFTWWLMLPAVALLILRVERADHRVFVAVLVLAVHGLFLFARTKMVSYTLVLFPLYMIAIANAIVVIGGLLRFTRSKNVLMVVVLVGTSAVMLDPERTQLHHTVYTREHWEQGSRRQELAAMVAEDTLSHLVHDPQHQVVFNLPALNHLRFNFRYGYECWDEPPTVAQVARLKASGYEVLVLQDGLPFDSIVPGVTVIADSVLLFPRIARL